MAVKFDDFSVQHADALKAHIIDMLAGDLMEEQQDAVIASKGVQPPTLQKNLAELKQEWLLN